MKKILKNNGKSLKLTTLGFTLVELLGILLILAVIALIAFPIVQNTIKNSQEKALERNIETIEEAAYRYSVENDIGYPSESNKKYLMLSDIQSKGFLDKQIINPVTDEVMNGCVWYYYDENYNQYVFEYDGVCELPPTLIELLLEQYPYLVTSGNGCTISGDNNYSYMGGCYLKGSPTNNYIWYSGFLWRIMGINADGTVRMITDENITAIPWGEDGGTAQDWDGSHAKEWLNDYFYSRLKGNDIITNQTWCSETTTDSSSSRTICTNNLSTELAKIGLITIDEYNLAGGNNSYLNIAQYQWTMTPSSGYSAWTVYNFGNALNNSVSSAAGLRAVINVNSNVTITGGNGTLGGTWSSEAGPYILNEDKNIEITGKLSEKATSGEYVLFAGKKYRVVDKDSNGNIKLILDGYYEEDGKIYKMSYGDNNTFSTTSGIGQKLNTDVLEWLVPSSNITDRNKLVTNYTWYQNEFAFGDSYKISLEETNPTRSIQATVGLIRIGEMLSSQSGSILTNVYTATSNSGNASIYWTMTPYTSSSSAWLVNNGGNASNSSVSNANGLRAVIVVNSDVTITGGNGTWSSPYKI